MKNFNQYKSSNEFDRSYESNKIYPYRFKTREEMIYYYGEDWMDAFGQTGWNHDMIHLLGVDYPYILSELDSDSTEPLDNEVDGWSICPKMLIENKPKVPNYKPKKFNRTYEGVGIIYYNKILKQTTTWPYRFKTEEEFKNEFGVSWRSYVHWNSSGRMDHLFGTNWEYLDKNRHTIEDININYSWFINEKMLTENENKPNYKPRKFDRSYEGIEPSKYYNEITKEYTIWPYRIKTKEEFDKEYTWFGNNYDGYWDIPDYTFIKEMDYLLGQTLEYDFPDDISNIEIKNKDDDQTWFITRYMITKNKDVKVPSYKPKKFDRLTESNTYKYPYRFKTEEEMIETVGENWRYSISMGWNETMDYFLGKELPFNVEELRPGNVVATYNYMSYTISWDMLTKNKLNKPNKPNYKPKKFNRSYEGIESSKYYNEITNEYTKWLYRFKTAEELTKEYIYINGAWHTPNYFFIEDMDYLLGQTLEYDFPDDVEEIEIEDDPIDGPWCISKGMITTNKLATPNYKPKKFNRLTESDTYKYPYRFKTEEEMIETVGENWKYRIYAGWSYQLNRFLGEEFPFNVYQLDKDSKYAGTYKSFIISWDMLIENKPKVPNYKPKKFNKLIESVNTYQYPYRFKTEEEMIEEYGEDWRDDPPADPNWTGTEDDGMDNLFGTEYPYKEDELDKGSYRPRRDRFMDKNGNSWAIGWWMLTKNKPKAPNYKPKKFNRSYEGIESNKYYNEVSEQFTKWLYRFKTEEEMIKDYGVDWYNNNESQFEYAGWSDSMDYLLGTTLEHEFDGNKIHIENTNIQAHFASWSIVSGMLTKNKLAQPNYKPKKFNRSYENKLNEEAEKKYEVYCKNRESSVEFEAFLFKNGFTWDGTGHKYVEMGWDISDVTFYNLENKKIDGRKGRGILSTATTLHWPIDKIEIFRLLNLVPNYKSKKFNRTLESRNSVKDADEIMVVINSSDELKLLEESITPLGYLIKDVYYTFCDNGYTMIIFFNLVTNEVTQTSNFDDNNRKNFKNVDWLDGVLENYFTVKDLPLIIRMLKTKKIIIEPSYKPRKFDKTYEGVRDLMKPKSEEDIRKSFEGSPNSKLFWGVRHNLLWLVKDALKEGADIHDRSDIALKLAIDNKNIEIVELLLQNNADIHIDGDYPIRYATEHGDINMIELLLKYNADPHANDDYAYQIAEEDGRKDILKMFKNYGH